MSCICSTVCQSLRNRAVKSLVGSRPPHVIAVRMSCHLIPTSAIILRTLYSILLGLVLSSFCGLFISSRRSFIISTPLYIDCLSPRPPARPLLRSQARHRPSARELSASATTTTVHSTIIQHARLAIDDAHTHLTHTATPAYRSLKYPHVSLARPRFR